MIQKAEDNNPALPWEELHTQRVFSITADQDWAPEWAMDFFLEWTRQLALKPHIFATNSSYRLQCAVGRGDASLGWHPNFALGSTHGDSPSAVVEHLRSIAPGATTFRTHRFNESSDALEALAQAGHTVCSQFPTLFSPGIVPLIHASGLVVLPVWFEDDIWMRDSMIADARIGASIDTPGLKILNLHPVHVALNSPDFDWYSQRRDSIYGADSPALELTYRGRGARTVAEEIVADAGKNAVLTDFPSLANRALELRRLSDA